MKRFDHTLPLDKHIAFYYLVLLLISKLLILDLVIIYSLFRQYYFTSLDGCGKTGKQGRSQHSKWILILELLPKQKKDRKRNFCSIIFIPISKITTFGPTDTSFVNSLHCSMCSVSNLSKNFNILCA